MFCALLEFTLVNYLWRKKPCEFDRHGGQKVGVAEVGANTCGGCNGIGGVKGDGGMAAANITVSVIYLDCK